MSNVDKAGKAVRVGAVLLQYEVEGKYPMALPRLLAVLDRLGSVDLSLVLVDNGREGGWEHRVSEHVLQVGGDNGAWEFSGFDRGLEALERWRPGSDLIVLVTDAFQAYGEEFLELIDRRVVDCALRLRAAVGWTDSFGLEPCRIGDLSYAVWLRSSFLFLPAETLATVRPLAADLGDLELFGGSPAAPFSERAAVSENLRELLLEWLTTRASAKPRLAERWHSRFELSAETMPRFKSKVGSILREHLLSARLQRAGTPCYDFRCLSLLAQQGRLESFLDRGGSSQLQWAGWRALVAEEGAPRSDGGHAGRAEISLLLAGEVGRSQRPEAASFLLEKVLPLVRQRVAGVRLLVAGDAPELRQAPGEEAGGPLRVPTLDALLASNLVASCAAVVAPPGSDPACLEGSGPVLDDGLPLVAASDILGGGSRLVGRSCVADSPVDIAAACCRLIAAGRGRSVAGEVR